MQWLGWLHDNARPVLVGMAAGFVLGIAVPAYVRMRFRRRRERRRRRG